jgi:hypothetical protein
MATPLLDLLKRLADAEVDCVVVGGMAATIHGVTSVTYDLDVCVCFDLETCQRILTALRDLDARHRMRPDRLPLSTDPSSFVGNRNLYVACSMGVVDFLGEISGVGGLRELKSQAPIVPLGDFSVRVMSLDQLITSKRAMSRPKDLRALVELELIRAKRRA